MQRHSPSVITYVVWHPAFAGGETLARQIFAFLNRDLDAPEARAIGIPVYFRSTPLPGGTLPLDITPAPDTLSFVILLVDRHMGEDPHWRPYIDDLLARLQGHVLPCLFTQVTAGLGPALHALNPVFVQLDTVSQAEQSQRLFHAVSHALSRLLLQPPQAEDSPSPPISLFVSHARQDGAPFAEALRSVLNQPPASAVFDANHIVPGDPFNIEIFTAVARSALIVILTDAYASREVLRSEFIEAKRLGRPIVVLNALQKGAERSFPYLGNVPLLRWRPPPEDPKHPEGSLKRLNQSIQEACRALVGLTLREVLHAAFFAREIERLKSLYPLLEQAQILTRPPELLTVPRPQQGAPLQPVIYPDPPIGDEELEILAPYHGPVLTPVLLPKVHIGAKPQMLFPNDWTFGISIGRPEPEELIVRGLVEEHIQEAAVECARYLLAHGVRLAYGGSFPSNGFTEQLFNLVRLHNRTGGIRSPRLDHYLAWHAPQGLPEESAAWAQWIRTIRTPLPNDLQSNGARPRPPFDAYTRARCMTAMREHMNGAVHARVVLGGKLVNYSGRWPGIIEEAYLILKAEKPLFLVGGFGGAAGWLARAVLGETREVPSMTEGFRKELADLSGQYSRHGRTGPDGTDLTEALAFFQRLSHEDFRNGLEPDENAVLMRSTNLAEILALLIKGCTRLALQRG